MLTLVEVRGPERDHDEAQEWFGRRDWPVLGRWPFGEGPTVGVLRARPDSVVFLVEVRFFGARNARTGQAAAWRVDGLARTAKLRMYVRRTELVDPDRELLPHWRVVTTRHRPAPPPAPRTRTSAARFRLRARRARITESLGRHDTGEFASGTPSEARRLARLALEPGAPPPAGVDVRPTDGRGRKDRPLDREEQIERGVLRLAPWLGLWLLATLLARAAHGGVVVFWLLVTAGSLLGVLRAAGRITPHRRAEGRVAGVVAAAVLAVLLHTDYLSGTSVALTPFQALVVCGTLFTVAGCYLLVRQWTWGDWLSWGAPLVGSLVISGVVASGSVLHAFYADGLDLNPQDLDVPGLWQAASAVKLLGFLALVLLAPAAWGMMKHFHRIPPRDGSNVALYALFLVAIVASVGGLAAQSAASAAEATKAAAHDRRTPPPYFGVKPKWTCVRPVVAADRLPTDGGVLASPATRPYLLISVAGGNAVLWDADAVPEPGAFKVPANRVQLVPAPSPDADCRPGRPEGAGRL
ncbi:NnrS multi-domain protein [Streptomyces sp. DH12]|uniref:NnrS multi-domain protein n=1 Tax=Streptomyces sp. DH12 TaxID=2857010 RepID=UPI001E44E9DE|nr:NnrS multi-domain protein [Streptomyces sp. DH12]